MNRRALDDMIGFIGPIDRLVAADEVIEFAFAFAWHFQSNNSRPAFASEPGCLFFRSGQPPPAVDKGLVATFRGSPFGQIFFTR